MRRFLVQKMIHGQSVHWGEVYTLKLLSGYSTQKCWESEVSRIL
uniref:Uncharacterized protein n=1 Tax=Anguilla anguilla TaxID=7936 RepID=A0A0E9T667_ANGAN